MPSLGKVELTFREDGKIVARAGTVEKILDGDEGDDRTNDTFYVDVEGWLILSHLAGQKLALQEKGRGPLGRLDPALLLEVGACPIVLRRPPSDPEMSGVLVHHLKEHGEIVCHNSGIVEPITFSLLMYLSGNETEIDEWLTEALARESLPLTARIDVVLRHLAERGNKTTWAKEMLEKYVGPALAKFPRMH